MPFNREYDEDVWVTPLSKTRLAKGGARQAESDGPPASGSATHVGNKGATPRGVGYARAGWPGPAATGTTWLDRRISSTGDRRPDAHWQGRSPKARVQSWGIAGRHVHLLELRPLLAWHSMLRSPIGGLVRLGYAFGPVRRSVTRDFNKASRALDLGCDTCATAPIQIRGPACRSCAAHIRAC